MTRLKASRLIVQALVLAMLGACASGGGGGGGGGGDAVSPPPPPPPSATPRPPAVPLPPMPGPATGPTPDLNSREYLDHWAPAGINANAAWVYQNGHGEGVLVGVIDDGIDSDHPELIGRISPRSTDIAPGRNALETTLSHGSEIASLIAGNFNGAQTVGIAYEATILAVRADNGSGGFPDTYLANAINYAVAEGVRVINLSLGSPSAPSAALQNAIRNATQSGVIFVVSAGNSGASAGNPNYPGFLATDPSVSNGLIIIAGGSNPDRSFNTVSNPAGAAAQFYLVAPGWQILVPDHGPPGPVPGFQTCGLGTNGDLCRIQGTSYASPHAAGAAAVLMSAFPGLTPAQVVQILFQSTDDMGAPGIDAQTGWGHLNLARAFEPIGAVSSPLAGLEVSPHSVVGALGAAFGDGFAASGAWQVAGFDAFDRTYANDLSRNWLRAHAGPALVAQAPHLWRARAVGQVRVEAAFAESAAPASLRTPIERAELEQNPMRIEAALAPGFTAAIAAHGARTDYAENGTVSHLDAVRADLSLKLTSQIAPGLSLSLINESGRSASPLSFAPGIERQASAARASFALGAAGLELTLGELREDEGVLGLVWSSSLGLTPGGETRFAGFGAHIEPAPNLRLSASAEWGLAEFSGAGWLEMVKPVRTSAFSIAARMASDSMPGALTLSLVQPLRVEDGAFAFMAPTATRYGRQSLAYEQRVFSPIPSGRELRLGLGYSYWRGEGFSAFGEALYVHEPGHVAGAEAEAVVRFGLRVAN